MTRLPLQPQIERRSPELARISAAEAAASADAELSRLREKLSSEPVAPLTPNSPWTVVGASLETRRRRAFYESLEKDAAKRLDAVRADLQLRHAMTKSVAEVSTFGAEIVADMVGAYTKQPSATIMTKLTTRGVQRLVEFAVEAEVSQSRQLLDEAIAREAQMILRVVHQQTGHIPGNLDSLAAAVSSVAALSNERDDQPAIQSFILGKALPEALKLSASFAATVVTPEELEAHVAGMRTDLSDVESRTQGRIARFAERVIDAHNATLDSVDGLRADVERLSGKIRLAGSAAARQEKLVAAMSESLDAVQAIQSFDRMRIEDKILALRAGAMDAYLGIEGAKKNLTALKDAQLRQDVITCANRVIGGVQVATELVETFDLLSGEDSSRLVKLAEYASTGAAIASNIASQNYAGAALAALALFKRNKKATPSLESRLLDQVLSRLDRVEEKLDRIEKRMEAFEKWSVAAHRDTMQAFELVFDSLARISARLHEIARLNMDSLQDGFYHCDRLLRLGPPNLESYADVVAFHRLLHDDCAKCFPALVRSFSRDALRDGKDWHSSVYARLNERDQEADLLRIFGEAHDYFLLAHPSSPRTHAARGALLASTLSADSVVEQNLLLKNLPALEPAADARHDELQLSQRFFNAHAVVRIGDLFLQFRLFFEIDGPGYVPRDLVELLGDGAWAEKKLRLVIEDVRNLLRIVTGSLIQQSVLSGVLVLERLRASLLIAGVPDDERRLAVSLLRRNACVAANFATSILYAQLGINSYQRWTDADGQRRQTSLSRFEAFRAYFDKPPRSSGSEQRLTEFFGDSPRMWLVHTSNQAAPVVLEIEVLYSNHEVEMVRIPIDFPENVRSGRLMYPPPFVELKALRERLLTELVELTFAADLNRGDETTRERYRAAWLGV